MASDVDMCCSILGAAGREGVVPGGVGLGQVLVGLRTLQQELARPRPRAE